MAPRVLLLSVLLGALAACAEPKGESATTTAPLSTMEVSPGPSTALPAMCGLERPVDIISAWVREPALRRGRIAPDLTATITAEERAIDPSFDGFRITEIDHVWSYGSPIESVSLSAPLSLNMQPTASGFTARFQRGRRGEAQQIDGCEDCFEFIPDSPVWEYRFERRDDCWELVAFEVLPDEVQ